MFNCWVYGRCIYTVNGLTFSINSMNQQTSLGAPRCGTRGCGAWKLCGLGWGSDSGIVWTCHVILWLTGFTPAEFCTFFPWICNLLLEPAWMRRRDFSTHYNLACWRNFAAISSRVRDEVVSFFNTTPWHHAFKIHTLARTKDARTVYSSFWIASLPSTGHFTWHNLRRTAETVRAEVTQAGSRDW